MIYHEYMAYMTKRERIISENRSRRMRYPPQPPLEVPPWIECPKVRVAYAENGDYIGTLGDGEEAPEGAVVKLEDAVR